MPRPKRTKVAPSATARARQPTTTSRHITSKEAAENMRAFDDISDPEERDAIASRRSKHYAREQIVGAESAMDDRIAEESTRKPLAAKANQDRRSEVDDELENIDGRHSSIESASPAIETGRREQRTPGIESSVLRMGNFRRRPRQPSILGRGPSRARSSSVESNSLLQDVLGSASANNTQIVDTSSTKPRSRATSFIGKNVAATPVINLGNFKRRARQPSILGTAQNTPASQAPLDYDLDDEDDFVPDDESTPLNLAKNREVVASSAGSSSSTRKRKLATRDTVEVPVSSLIRRSTSGGNDAEEQRVPATASPRPTEMEEADEESVLPSIEAHSDRHEILSDTMAPPLSSSPTRPSPMLTSRYRAAPSRGRGRSRIKTPKAFNDEDSDISSPPSLTHSPNRAPSASRNTKKPAAPPSTFSTRQLQALLPRRRRPARDVFDIASSEDDVDASGLASDDDELTHLNARARSRRAASQRARTPAARPVKKPTALSKGTGQKRTYGTRLRATSDKENDGDDHNDSLGPVPDNEGHDPENSQDLEKRVGKELKMAARKFAEVDKWEMEFEDVTASGSSPSRDAR